jgi:Zn-dependent peptidase ImmA (M78 family)
MRRVAEKAYTLLKTQGMDHPPINPSDIAKNLGIKIERAAFSDDLSGVLMRSDGSAIIALNKSHHKVRQRFTIAHELGHFVLNHKGDMFIDQKVLNKRDGRSSIAIDPQEIEANAFAASLLMPEEMLLAEVVKLVPDQTTDRRELIGLLAKTFDVSIQAIEFRLINLGLISAEV